MSETNRKAKPRPIAGSLLLAVIIAFLATAWTWASVTELDEVTRGQGKVVPSRSLQVVESLEGGVIESIQVQRGQTVKQGDVLMVLNVALLEGTLKESRQRYYALMARSQRLRTEVLAIDEPDIELEFPAELEQQAPGLGASERELYLARLAELESDIEVLDRRLNQKRQELAENRVSIETARRAIILTRDEMSIMEPLVRQGLEPKTTLLQLRRTELELQGEVERAGYAAERLASAIKEVESERQAVYRKFRAEALSDLSEVTSKMAELEQTLPARADQVARAIIRSPVDGMVNTLHVNTLGSVAGPGEPLAEIVPLDDKLLVEAYIRPKDIGFLYPGQPVRIKLTAYDFARYGGLDGKLTMIGADAVEVPDSEELMYPVRVATGDSLKDADGRPLDIIPGMVAEVDILSGKRTVMAYLMEPVVKVRDRALRD